MDEPRALRQVKEPLGTSSLHHHIQDAPELIKIDFCSFLSPA